MEVGIKISLEQTLFLLPNVPMRDKLLWDFNHRVVYSVKSGYQAALRLRFPEFPSCSESFSSGGNLSGTPNSHKNKNLFFFLESLERNSTHTI